MTIIKQIKGNLLDAKEKFIAHQCNCLTLHCKGLAESIAQKYPWANVYAKRKAMRSHRNCADIKTRSCPGSVDLIRHPQLDLTIICLFAQYCPGPVGRYNYAYDETAYDETALMRLDWFKQCLLSLTHSKIIDGPIAMPYGIGCGLAKGNWSSYHSILEESLLEIVLYKY